MGAPNEFAQGLFRKPEIDGNNSWFTFQLTKAAHDKIVHEKNSYA